MYGLAEKIGQVITIKSIRGDEYIARLLAVDTDNNVITVEEPKIVYIENNQVMILPFALTAETTTVQLSMTNIFAIMDTISETALEYNSLVDESSVVAGDE